MHTGSPALAVPFVLDALSELDASEVQARGPLRGDQIAIYARCLADPGWDPLIEPPLESIRCAMADLADSPAPRIRWQVGREVVWDTDSPRQLVA